MSMLTKTRCNSSPSAPPAKTTANDGDFVIKNYNFALANLKEREAYLNSLQPSTDRQKTAKADAEQAAIAIGQTRMQMALALVEPISWRFDISP